MPKQTGDGSVSRLAALEMARGAAALLVVLYHATAVLHLPKYLGAPPLNGFFYFGNVGVDFFFALSGYILFHVHGHEVGKPGAVRRFLWKRWLRVFPPYWAATLLVIPAYALFPGFGKGDELAPGRLFSSFSLLPLPQAPVLPVAWSLVFEVLFYVLFALALKGRAVAAMVLGGWIVTPALGMWLGNPAAYPGFYIGTAHHWQFLLGSAACVCAQQKGLVERPTAWVVLGATILLLTAIGRNSFGFHPPDPLFHLMVGIGAAIALCGLGSDRSTVEGSGRRFMTGLGSASYSIYLIHYAVLSLAAKLLGPWIAAGKLPASFWLLLLSAAGVVGGGLFHRWVENPFLAWGRRLRPQL